MVLVLLVFLVMLLSREASETGVFPAFLPSDSKIIHLELSIDDTPSRMYQFNDGLTPMDVIKLTNAESKIPVKTDQVWSTPLLSGERLVLVKKGRKIESLRREWMSSSHRVAMTIPLHPDRMSRADWLLLPGIGEVLAQRIENDRQKNGDYGSVQGLLRVKGIGEKRIAHWEKFFSKS